jgi:DNA-binding IclR family transcriptional regulator
MWRLTEKIFGDKAGDPDAETLLDALAKHGGSMTQTEVSDLFSHHRNAPALHDLRQRLERLGRIRVDSEGTTGRPVTHWVLVPSPVSLFSQLAGLPDYVAIARDVANRIGAGT